MKRHKALISILNVDLTNGSGVTCGRGGEVCRGGSGGGGGGTEVKDDSYIF